MLGDLVLHALVPLPLVVAKALDLVIGHFQLVLQCGDQLSELSVDLSLRFPLLLICVLLG